MRDSLTPKLATAWPIQYEENQLDEMRVVGRANQRKICHLARIFTDIGLRVTRLNGGIVPTLEQVRLQRALVRRAKRDARRTR